MGHMRISLRPLAVLLAVVSICMTMLAILAIATANADLRVAGKYADTVKRRYELEAKGQALLREAGEALHSGAMLSSLPDTDTDADGVTWKVIWKEDCKLTVGIRQDEAGSLRVVCWRMGRRWEPEAGTGDLWDGQ